MRQRLRLVTGTAWLLVRGLARVLLTERGDELIAQARETVRRIDGHDWPGEKKRQAAFAILLQRLGVPPLMANVLIELAVLELRGEEE